MEKIKLYDKVFRPYIPYEEFICDIEKTCQKLNQDYKDCGMGQQEDIPIILCVLNGAIPFTAEVLRRLDFPCELSILKLSSYEGTCSTGEVKFSQPLTCSVKNRRILIIEDIVDTGCTIQALRKHLQTLGAKDIRICTLFYKEEAFRFKEEFQIDYYARSIQNQFIVGFGLDYNELGRNYKDIYILDE